MTRKLKFETPINETNYLHGTLLVKFRTDDDEQNPEIEIDEIIYTQAHASNKKADITYLVKEHAAYLYDRLKAMAENLLATEGHAERRPKMMEG